MELVDDLGECAYFIPGPAAGDAWCGRQGAGDASEADQWCGDLAGDEVAHGDRDG